jgi:hypothetical protein
MSNREDGGPAFPSIHSIDGNWVTKPLAEFRGMTLRDYFAAAAIPACIASFDRGRNPVGMTDQIMASVAYQVADAMIAEREK